MRMMAQVPKAFSILATAFCITCSFMGSTSTARRVWGAVSATWLLTMSGVAMLNTCCPSIITSCFKICSVIVYSVLIVSC